MEPDFGGLRIAAMESRRASDMARLIEKYNGLAYVSPSMREVPIEPNRPAIDFAYRILTGEITYLIFMTGVGFRQFLKATERHIETQRLLDSLSDITTVCRGPKPVAAMREFGLKPTHRVAEPNTWRELLQLVDTVAPVQNQTVGLQEYGVSNTSLVAGLEARGGRVTTLKVYGWDYPEDTAALEQNVRAISEGARDVLLRTSGHQVVNMLRMADQLQLTDRLRAQLKRMVVASIGPTTTDMLSECELTA